MPALMVHMNKGPVFMTINAELPETKDICRCAVHYVKYLFKLLTRTKKKKKHFSASLHNGHPEENTPGMFLKSSHRNDPLFVCRVAGYCPIRVHREKGPDRVKRPLRVKGFDTLTCHNCEKMSADVFWSDQHHF